MKTSVVISLLCIFFVFGCTNKPVSDTEKSVLPAHEGVIRITGAYAMMPLMQRLSNEYKKNNPSVKFELKTLGSGDAMTLVETDESDLTMISSDLPMDLDSSTWVISVARLSVVIIANKSNPYWENIISMGISRDDLISLFTNEKMNWDDVYDEPGVNPVKVYLRDDDAGSTKILTKYLWLEEQELKGNYIFGEDQLIREVANDPLALSYCNFIYTFDPSTKEFLMDIGIVPLDLNHNQRLDMKENFYSSFSELQRAMWLGKYPCTLNRVLQFVASEKPSSKEVYDFLQWIYDEGQTVVKEMGYMELRSSEIKHNIAYLEN